MSTLSESQAPAADVRPIELRQRIQLAHMESDLAYFQARMEIIGEPKTSNESAQYKLFQLLCRTLGNEIVQVKREMAQKGR